MVPSPREQAAFLLRNAVDALPEGAVERQLAEGRPLRVKLGIDPTAPDIHLGHTVVLRKLREFQDLGHTVVLIVGDYTARIGDPSGRSSERPVLPDEELEGIVSQLRYAGYIERQEREGHETEHRPGHVVVHEGVRRLRAERDRHVRVARRIPWAHAVEIRRRS